jgi:hypothetical protein
MCIGIVSQWSDRRALRLGDVASVAYCTGCPRAAFDQMVRREQGYSKSVVNGRRH